MGTGGAGYWGCAQTGPPEGSPWARAEVGSLPNQPGPGALRQPPLSGAVLPAGGEEAEVGAAAAAAETREPDAGHAGAVREQHERAAAAAGTALPAPAPGCLSFPKAISSQGARNSTAGNSLCQTGPGWTGSSPAMLL